MLHALAQRPDLIAARLNLGVVQQELGRLEASAASVSATGLGELSLTASNLGVAINLPDVSQQVVDWAQAPLSVSPNVSIPKIDMSGLLGRLNRASGPVSIDVGGFFTASGDFSIERSTASAKLADSGGSTKALEVLKFGAESASAFAGLNGGTANAAGFSLNDVDVALAVATDVSDRSRQWTALSATASAELSMGMSGDYEIAIEEGATQVRIGSALFGPRATLAA